MKFYNALLILAATVSLTLGNGLDLSSVEDEGIAGADLDAGFGNSSDIETGYDHNAAPVEEPVIVPPSLPSMDNSIPADTYVPEATGSDSIPVDDSIPADMPADIPADDTSIPADQFPPAADGISGQNVDVPDLGSDIEPVDTADVNAQDVSVPAADGAENVNIPAADDNGEGSDDYGESQPIDQIDGADVVDVNSANTDDIPLEADLPEEGSDVENQAEGSKDQGSNTGGKIAGSLAGVAAVSSAGLFWYIKRSKHAGLESVRTQITMV